MLSFYRLASWRLWHLSAWWYGWRPHTTPRRRRGNDSPSWPDSHSSLVRKSVTSPLWCNFVRPNKKIPLFPVSRPSLIFTPDPNTFYRTWVGLRKRRRKTSQRSVFLYEFGQWLHNNSDTNTQKLQFKTKKAVNYFINQ